MNLIKVTFLVVILFLAINCTNQPGTTTSIPPETKNEICSSNPAHTYELFLPNRNPDDIFPLMIVLDPHGEGKKALDHFISGKGKNQALIIAASNLIENNFMGYDQAISELISDVVSKYPADKNTILLAGFSGGARMALSYAGQHKMAGVIACGAFANAQQTASLYCPVYGLVGTGDFNFMEYAQALFQPNSSAPLKTTFSIFDGGHEWPSTENLRDAVDFMLNQKTIASENDREVFFKSAIKNAKQLEQNNSLLAADLVYRKLQILFPLRNEKKKLDKKLEELYANPNYQKEVNRWIAQLNQENKLRQHYIQALQNKSFAWWKNEKKAMEEKLAGPHTFQSALLNRIKSFWGIVLFSQVRSAIQGNQLEQAAQLLKIYQLLEPENPDAWYYEALYQFKQNKKEEAKEFLTKADSLGFSDEKRLERDFGGLE